MMYKRICLFMLLFGAMLQQSLKAQYDSLSPAVTLDDQGVVDFDTIVQGDTVKYTFWYTNTGKTELHIKQVWPSCGCTMPTYTPANVKPGERGRIDVEFHSAGFTGTVQKYVIVLSNAPEVQPKFKAFILSKAQQTELGFVRKQDRGMKPVKKRKGKVAKPKQR